MSTRIAVARDRRSMRMVWKTLRFRHVGLAFFWACSMLTFRSSILLQGPANTPELETLVVLVSFIANMTTLFA
ncbi:MAG: LuxR family transcriptional regulator, partial [Eggerthella lenta]